MADLYLKALESERKALWATCRLKGLPRDSFFITTKTKPCAEMTEAACSAQAEKEFLQDLSDLGLDYVDLILLHGASHHGKGACAKPACTKDLGQWKVRRTCVPYELSSFLL